MIAMPELPGKASHDQVELAGVLPLTATGDGNLRSFRFVAVSPFLLFAQVFCHEGLVL
jgi:hypothetical protein